jgi:hypothetical protein
LLKGPSQTAASLRFEASGAPRPLLLHQLNLPLNLAMKLDVPYRSDGHSRSKRAELVAV